MSQVAFGTKAENLATLSGKLVTGNLLPLILVEVGQWRKAKENVLSQIESSGWFDKSLIVRSSCLLEDTQHSTMAGHFKSLLDIRGKEQVSNAIDAVIASFGRINDKDQVLIQPMLTNVVRAGVAFSRDPNSGGHYYVVNYDEGSGSTDTITAGTSNDVKVVIGIKSKRNRPNTAWLQRLADLLDELSSLFDNDAIDIEFAVTENDDLYLLQVRPLVLPNSTHLSCEQQTRLLSQIEKKLAMAMQPHPYLLGSQAVFGVMPDWNPAEIIGIRPRPLTLSLYKELITDAIWAYQRANYGYRNLRSFPLLKSFGGFPYIDVRVSFNSFIPSDIEPGLAGRLVDHYLDQLRENPHNHDKVEFEIIYSCYTLDIKNRIEKLERHGFAQGERNALVNSLRRLTNRIVDPESGLWKVDIEKIAELEQRQQKILDSDLDILEKIYWLLEDCKRYGTLPFAGLARAGFIAVQMLKSLINVGVLSEDDYERFMSSLNTVGSQISTDFELLSRDAFLQRYGHLRPGTYDICSLRYDEAPEKYFDWSTQGTLGRNHERREFRMSLEKMNMLEELMAQHELNHSGLSVLNFIKSAIEGREYSKFVFTRSLSNAMQLLQSYGEEQGFDREDMSYVDIGVVKYLYGSWEEPRNILEESIRKGKAVYEETRSLVLPPVITDPSQIWWFKLPRDEPNFITLKSVEGKVTSNLDNRQGLRGSIVFIASADPGYDWLFATGIAGLVTMYGGVNSHMAIRAGELGVPAVIGAGEMQFRTWAEATLLQLDCANRKVIVLK
ncbi:MAG: PEP-utilizing enzyme [Gammaproteobacteria bacterium]|nr:PEP-utilizing enzyme [Gammaproteobacteria bacterium]